MTKDFSLGAEKESCDSPSIQKRRIYFLELIQELKPEVVLTLLATTFQPFCGLLKTSRRKIASICKLEEAKYPENAPIMREPKAVRARAIREFISDWRSLQKLKGAGLLGQALQDWAQSQNLTDAWCLDHALLFLSAFYVEALELNWGEFSQDHYLLAELYISDLSQKAWVEALCERNSAALLTQFTSNAEFEKRTPNLFSFAFDYKDIKFDVSGPRYKSDAKFIDDVNKALEAHIDARFKAHDARTVIDIKKVFDKNLRSYLRKVRKVEKEMSLTVPPVYKKAEDRFKWLIEYQIPSTKKYREIAREVDKGEKTVRENIANAAALIGLKLRDPDKPSGRPKGSKNAEGSRGRVQYKEGHLRANNAGHKSMK